MDGLEENFTRPRQAIRAYNRHTMCFSHSRCWRVTIELLIHVNQRL